MSSQKLSTLICCLVGILLTGCGENSLSAGGVSLGGTGTGINTQPSPPIIGDGESHPPSQIDQEQMISLQQSHIKYRGKINDTCNGINRFISFKQKINENYEEFLVDKNIDIPLNSLEQKVILNVKTCNETSSPVYEHIANCTSPITLLDENGLPSSASNISCNDSELIHIYQPNQCHTYEIEYNLPTVPKLWRFKYATQYTFNLLEGSSITECAPLETSLEIENK
ncbi:hypothetical protein IV507_00350 [Acinetobacter nosocomialis]|uniref:hypothetical protein n=1 Tax=Acinetobacter nosocomialis TaxID=106654 RepID=UPI002F414849